MRFRFKQEHSFAARKAEGFAIRQRYPDRIPVIVERNPRTRLGDMAHRKYLVPPELSVRDFHHLLWQRHMDCKEGFWLFVDNIIPPTSITMGCLYEEHHEEDFFLYITYSDENVFG